MRQVYHEGGSPARLCFEAGFSPTPSLSVHPPPVCQFWFLHFSTWISTIFVLYLSGTYQELSKAVSWLRALILKCICAEITLVFANWMDSIFFQDSAHAIWAMKVCNLSVFLCRSVLICDSDQCIRLQNTHRWILALHLLNYARLRQATVAAVDVKVTPAFPKYVSRNQTHISRVLKVFFSSVDGVKKCWSEQP